MNSYQEYCKPSLAGALNAMGLDKLFHRANEGSLYYYDSQQNERQVLDLLGGYGAVLLGHNHPSLVKVATSTLLEQVPFNNQFSIRNAPAELAKQLNELLRTEAGSYEDFRFSFTSTGAESVEVAIKHAEVSRQNKIAYLREESQLGLYDLMQHDDLKAAISDLQFKKLGLDPQASMHDIIAAVDKFNDDQLCRQPHFVALDNAFHGKLTSSIQLTHGLMYRGPFKNMGLKTHFIPVSKLKEKITALADEVQAYIYVAKVSGDEVVLKEVPVPVISAILAEPVQGEGGVHCLTKLDAESLHAARDAWDCPLIADEIQSGSGRCGSLLAGKAIGLKPDYIVLSKALGGGMAKIGLVAIRASRYCAGFDLIQSSTFGEDEHSAEIALKYIHLLYRDEAKALKDVERLGATLIERLGQVKEKFPDIIASVRGRGLLIGVEFNSQKSAGSIMIRSMAYQESLGYMLTGFLMNNHNIRVAPSASASNVIRMEPSICITEADIEKVAKAFEDACQALRYQDSYYFLRYLSEGSPSRSARDEVADFRNQYEVIGNETTEPDVKVAFINHLISSDWLWQVDASMEGVSAEESDYLVRKMDFDWRVAPMPPMRVQSNKGVTADFIMYPLGITSPQIEELLQKNDLEKIRNAIDERVSAARQDGCKVAGLGMFTSVVTNNCKSIRAAGIGLTTGNSLTVAMAVEAVARVIEEKNIQVSKASIIGASGNIGSVYAAMISDYTNQLILVGSGRRGAPKRLLKAAYSIYESCWRELCEGVAPSGVAKILAEQPEISSWISNPETAPAERIGEHIYELMVTAHRERAPIVITNDLSDIGDSELVVCATNASEAFIDETFLKHGVVICDVSIPHNIGEDVLDIRQDITCIRGGIVKTPNNESLDKRVRAYLGEGEVYACMAETIVLGLDKSFGHYSYGDLNKKKVKNILALAEKQGFSLTSIKNQGSM